jgi:transcriptional regulator with XRE-family HTH domain
MFRKFLKSHGPGELEMNDREQRPTESGDERLMQQIRAGCLRRGWDDGELARRAGVSRTTLFYLRRGTTRRPRASTLSRIARALDIDPVGLVQPGSTSASDADSERRRQFDRRTNPLVAVVCGERPELFAGWSEADWDELYSQFGTGGALTEEGVALAAAEMNRRRETVRRLQVVLETHLAEVAERLVETLFELTRPQSNIVATPQLDELLTACRAAAESAGPGES